MPPHVDWMGIFEERTLTPDGSVRPIDWDDVFDASAPTKATHGKAALWERLRARVKAKIARKIVAVLSDPI